MVSCALQEAWVGVFGFRRRRGEFERVGQEHLVGSGDKRIQRTRSHVVRVAELEELLA